MSKELIEGVDYILNEKGHKVNPTTGKQLKGFALNKNKINLDGRPKGSRNKSSLMKAQYQLDEAAEIAVKTLIDLTTNNITELGIKDNVPPTVRLAAAKELLAKAIANEKEKPDTASKANSDNSVDVGEDLTPLVLLQPIERKKA